MFRSAETLKPLYEQLSRQAVLSVKAEHVASFLGKKITPQLAQEIGSRFETRIEGACIKHRLGKAQVKMYDKFHLVLRIETTANDVSFFKHHRRVEYRAGPQQARELAPLKKTIYSLIDLCDILLGCCDDTCCTCPPSTSTAPGFAPWIGSARIAATKIA